MQDSGSLRHCRWQGHGHSVLTQPPADNCALYKNALGTRTGAMMGLGEWLGNKLEGLARHQRVDPSPARQPPSLSPNAPFAFATSGHSISFRMHAIHVIYMGATHARTTASMALDRSSTSETHEHLTRRSLHTLHRYKLSWKTSESHRGTGSSNESHEACGLW